MIYHILNGDGLAAGFDLEGEIVVCREALIDGHLKAQNLDEFWNLRAEFVKNSYLADDYFEKVKAEFDKLNNLEPTDEVNLWFGDEAFCQVNLWLVLSLISNKNAAIYRVYPDSGDWNCNFENPENCFETRQKLTANDLQLGKQLWNAFCMSDFDKLTSLGKTTSEIFKALDQICQALTEKESKPKELLREITKNSETDFAGVFSSFKEKAGIYGFGDLQVKSLLKDV